MRHEERVERVHADQGRNASQASCRPKRKGLAKGFRGAASWAMAALFIASPAAAISATFDGAIGFGFDPSGLPPVDLTIDENTPFLGAGDPTDDPDVAVALTGSDQICILPGDSTVCQANFTENQTGPFSVLQSFTVSAVDSEVFTGPFTLMLTDLENAAGFPQYADSDVSIDLTPMPIDLDTSAVSGFIWDPESGVNGFNPFVVVCDTTDESSLGNVYYYVGWSVTVGSTVTFKVDVNADPDLDPTTGGNPQLMANAIPVVVPEPGAALLLALGLAGLSFAGRRRE